VNAPTWNLRRSFAGRMLADPARRSRLMRSARRVCCAAKPYGPHVAVRSCALLATDSRDMTLSYRSFYSCTRVVPAILCPRSTRSQTAISSIAVSGVGWFVILSTSCTCCTITQLPSATGSRTITPYLSSTVREVRPDCTARCAPSMSCSQGCAPHLTALAPPTAWPLRLHARAIHYWRLNRATRRNMSSRKSRILRKRSQRCETRDTRSKSGLRGNPGA